MNPTIYPIFMSQSCRCAYTSTMGYGDDVSLVSQWYPTSSGDPTWSISLEFHGFPRYCVRAGCAIQLPQTSRARQHQALPVGLFSPGEKPWGKWSRNSGRSHIYMLVYQRLPEGRVLTLCCIYIYIHIRIQYMCFFAGLDHSKKLNLDDVHAGFPHVPGCLFSNNREYLGWVVLSARVFLMDTKNYGKSTFFMGKSTISMAIFNSDLFVYQAG